MTAINPNNQAIKAHSVQLVSRRKAQITGVTEVCSFHETEIVLKIASGQLVITGENLHVGKLLLDEGKLEVDGTVDSLVYEKPRPSVRRLLKRRRENHEAFL